METILHCNTFQILFLKLEEHIETHGPIELDKTLDELRQEPYSLPSGFVWDSLDINNSSVVSFVSY